MADPSSDAPPDVVFRANKRRKMIRKRNLDDLDEAARIEPQDTGADVSEDNSKGLLSTVKRPAMRKHGIGFSTAGSQQQGPDATAVVETALVPTQNNEEEPSPHNRFKKPTEKAAVVVEDRHLTAYVESKLAEVRYTASIPTTTQTGIDDVDDTIAQSSSSSAPVVKETLANNLPHNDKARPNTRRATNKPPRRQRQKDPGELAREAMVEQILGESKSHVPMYAHSTVKNHLVPNEPGVDNDEAVAAAFKAEFLAQVGERARRGPRIPPSTKGEKQPSNGPKLGGSRHQRFKMRKALQAARAATGEPVVRRKKK